jgi:hypothetical protein
MGIFLGKAWKIFNEKLYLGYWSEGDNRGDEGWFMDDYERPLRARWSLPSP